MNVIHTQAYYIPTLIQRIYTANEIMHNEDAV